MIYLIFLTFVLRLIIIIASLPIKNFDLNSYLFISEKTIRLVNIYQKNYASLHYPYLPLFLYLESIVYIFARYINLNPILLIKLIINFFDLGNGVLVYFLTKKNKNLFIHYIFNPVSLLIFAFHGQFDAIPIFFILLSIYYLKIKKREIKAIFFYALAVIFKTWPILLIFPFIFKFKEKKLFFLLFLINLIIVITIYVNIFKSNYLVILKTISEYRSLFNYWGLGLLTKIFFFRDKPQPPIYLQKILLFLFLFNYLIYSIKIVIIKNSLIKNIYQLLIFFYCFTFGFAPQYLSWIIPFLIILQKKNYIFIIISIGAFLIINYLSWIVFIPHQQIIYNLGAITLWLLFIKLWFINKYT